MRRILKFKTSEIDRTRMMELLITGLVNKTAIAQYEQHTLILRYITSAVLEYDQRDGKDAKVKPLSGMEWVFEFNPEGWYDYPLTETGVLKVAIRPIEFHDYIDNLDEIVRKTGIISSFPGS